MSARTLADLKPGDKVEVVRRIDANTPRSEVVRSIGVVGRLTPTRIILREGPPDSWMWFRRSDGRSIGGPVFWLRLSKETT